MNAAGRPVATVLGLLSLTTILIPAGGAGWQ